MAKRNPPWTREELILALDLYLRRWANGIDVSDQEVRELSHLLNELPLHRDRPDAGKFRNPNGVYMKLGNFARVDPNYAGKGLSRGNHLEKVVWDELANDPARLRDTAQAIRDLAWSAPRTPLDFEEESAAQAIEGKLLFREHQYRERSASLVKHKKQQVFRTLGRLACEVCGFDFHGQYGGQEEPFIECHHRMPLHRLRQGQRTTLKDLALVCPNCHRMLHRTKDPSDLNALRARIRVQFTELIGS